MKLKALGLAALIVLMTALTGCGGGGGGGSAGRVENAEGLKPAPVADVRDGSYIAYAHNGREYTMTVAINAGTVFYTDGTTTHTASFVPAGTSTTVFRLQGSASNDGFVAANDALIGSAKFTPSGPSVPFVAARVFATTLEEVAGEYNQFLTDKPLGGTVNNAVNTFRLTPSGSMNLCSHNSVYVVSACPVDGQYNYSITVASSLFTVTDGSTTFFFRVAKIGTDKVYLRANTFSDGQERFRIALHNAASVPAGTFTSAIDSQGNAMTYSFDGTTAPGSFSATGVSATGSAVSLTGAAHAPAGVSGLRAFSTAADGSYFMQRAGNFGVVISARDNPARPGYLMLGVR